MASIALQTINSKRIFTTGNESIYIILKNRDGSNLELLDIPRIMIHNKENIILYKALEVIDKNGICKLSLNGLDNGIYKVSVDLQNKIIEEFLMVVQE